MAEGRINLRGMIRLDDVEDLLTEVLRRLDAQDGALSRLTAVVETMMPAKAASESYAELKGGIDVLAREIETVRGDILVKVDGRRVPVAAVVSGNYDEIKQLSKRAPLLVERGEMELQFKATNVEWKQAVSETRSWAASNDIMTKIQSAHTETVRRLNGVEAMVACKLDRSEVGYLEGLANNFESFGAFQKEVRSSIGDLDNLSAEHARLLAESNSRMDALKTATDSAFSKLTMVTTKTETRALAKELEKQQHIMKNFCDVKDVANINEKVLSSTERLRIAEAQLKKHQGELTSINESLSTKADAKDLNAFVKHARVDAIDRTLLLKGEKEIIQKNSRFVEEKFQRMDNEYEDLKTRLGVALRFVEWFTHRGETYEHNMKLIDKHLNGLATSAADPKNKQVFDSAIRYTPLRTMEADKKT